MQYNDLKQHFIKHLLSTGENNVDAAPPDIKVRVPEPVLQRWVNNFYRAHRFPETPRNPRLINHFKLGADPEFALLHPTNGLMNAEDFRLKSGVAFGADNNGRLVELRPEPSRFALHVLASMLEELRWLAICKPKMLELQWKSGAWSGHDGLGGHVHFGRKLVKQKLYEVAALDRLTDILLRSEIFPSKEHAQRQRGHGNYGAYSDTRQQVHGYEYRTAPSWLDSPWKAYLFLTLSKLAVARPDFVLNMPGAEKFGTATEARKFIRNMLATFKGLDDDARIASVAYSVLGLPQPTTMDFKAAWGIGPTLTDLKVPEIIPGSIPGTRSTIDELFRHLCNGTGLLNKVPGSPNWEHHTIPKDFKYILDGVQTRVSPGFGEFLLDLVTPMDISFMFEARDTPKILYGRTLAPYVDKDALRRLSPKFRVSVDDIGLSLVLSKGSLTAENVKETTRILVDSGLFPLYRLRDAARADLKQWEYPRFTEAKAARPGSVKLFSEVF